MGSVDRGDRESAVDRIRATRGRFLPPDELDRLVEEESSDRPSVTFFVDANVIVYAATESDYRAACLQILQAVANGDADGRTSPAVLEEVWYVERSGRAGPLDGLAARAPMRCSRPWSLLPTRRSGWPCRSARPSSVPRTEYMSARVGRRRSTRSCPRTRPSQGCADCAGSIRSTPLRCTGCCPVPGRSRRGSRSRSASIRSRLPTIRTGEQNQAVSGEMREERKVVTALFADVVGSTQLTEKLDPEDARELLGAAVRRMVDAVEAFGGTVKDLAGDGILALFGAPVTHEDDRRAGDPRRTPHRRADRRRRRVPVRSGSASRPGWWCSGRSAVEVGSNTARPATR